MARTLLPRYRGSSIRKESIMLFWAFVFLFVALVAAIFGFTGIAVASAGIAKIIFFLFLIIFLLTLVFSVTRKTRVVA
jgi:uncharacterized membrane protein YtjA (UPF0391 family)